MLEKFITFKRGAIFFRPKMEKREIPKENRGGGYIKVLFSNKGKGIHNEDAKSRKEHDGKMTLQKKSKALNVMRQQAVT